MKKIKKMMVLTILVLSTLSLTGCMNFIKSCIREDEGKAMERYLEEKYDDEFTCIGWHYVDGYNFYWNKSSFSGDFESAKYPEKIISVGGGVTENRLSYTFRDDYQAVIYEDKVQKIIEITASKYFQGEHYVFVDNMGVDDEDVGVMPFEEYITLWRKYSIGIIVDGISDEEACALMERFVADVEEQGFRCDFWMAKVNTEKISKEACLNYLENDKNYAPRASNHVIWLYDKFLSLTEEGEEN